MTLLFGLLLATMPQKTEVVAFTFRDASYVHRYSKDDLHEFTPKAQADLGHFADMITFNTYKKVKDGEGLAATANAVLQNYKDHKAVVVKTDSVPKTEKQPAEHLIVVLFARPEFVEASFARFRLVGGQGVSVVYSHRVYGKTAGDAMSAWLEKNGNAVEKALMAWKSLPPIPKGD